MAIGGVLGAARVVHQNGSIVSGFASDARSGAEPATPSGQPVKSPFTVKRLRPRYSLIVLASVLAGGCERDDHRFEKRAPLPVGRLEVPDSPTVELGPAVLLTLSGWAVSEDGIAEVNVYIDRRLARSSGLLIPRPDVASRYPAIPGSRQSGFQLLLEPAEIGAGSHEVVLQVRTGRGAVRELGRLTVMAHP